MPGPGDRFSERWVVHNLNAGPVWEDSLFDFEVVGHYRYTGAEPVKPAVAVQESSVGSSGTNLSATPLMQ